MISRRISKPSQPTQTTHNRVGVERAQTQRGQLMALKHVLIVQSQGRENSLEEAHLRACYPCQGPDLIAACHPIWLVCVNPYLWWCLASSGSVFLFAGRWKTGCMMSCWHAVHWCQQIALWSAWAGVDDEHRHILADQHFYRLESKSRFM